MTLTHVVVDGGDKLTLCGIRTKLPEALPFVAERFVAAHVAGHGMEVCPPCAEQMPR